MEIFIGNRLEEFKLNRNGLTNSRGSQAPSDQTSREKKGGENESSVFKLDPTQEGVLLHCLFEPEIKLMNEQSYLDFNHGFNELALVNAIEYLMKKYDKLRSSFNFDRFSIPVKKVYNKVPVPLINLDYSWMSEEERTYQIQLFMKEDQIQTFDFSAAPLTRMTLIQNDVNAFRFVWTSHEIILTETNQTDIMAELWMLYEGFSSDYQL